MIFIIYGSFVVLMQDINQSLERGKLVKGEIRKMFTISDILYLVLNPVAMVTAVLMTLELVLFTDLMLSRQRVFNISTILCLVAFSVNWVTDGSLIRMILASVPFVLNALDILHLPKKEKGFALINWVEFIFLGILSGINIYFYFSA